ncbi:hypothetical protein AB0B15_34650 [Streptomyces sp. NPDC045456]|uniref:hypothetical protein n=1 Tax=Streptomyces sp. NPDC045456 TaxID=3155254 RepID=UPI003402BF23
MDAKKDGDGMVGDFFVWGRVEAAAVYDICTYDDGRSLRGFTKPVKRISGNPHERGLLPDTAAEYRNGPGRASGFRIRPRLVPLLNEATDDDES